MGGTHLDWIHAEHEAAPTAGAAMQRDPRQSSRSGPLPRLPLWPHDPPAGTVEALPPAHSLPPHWSFTAAAFTVFAEIGSAVGSRERQRRPETPLPPRPPAPGAGHGLAFAISAAFAEGRIAVGAAGRAGGALAADARNGKALAGPRPGWEHLPEVVVAGLLRDAGAGDVEVRRFLTFGAAMNRGQDPDALWLAALDALRLAPWLFDPDSVADAAQIADALRAARLSVSPFADALAWRAISLHLFLPGPISAAVVSGEGDAPELLAALSALDPATGARHFPLLCAPRTAGRWVRMLAVPGRARIANLAQVPLTVDGAVRRAGEALGVTHTRGLPLEAVRPHIQAVWQQDVATGGAVGPPGLEGTAAALEPALSYLGRWGCGPCGRAGHRRPVADVCAACTLPEPHRC
ncbi:MAG: hypothetical protein FJZ01_06305 [Candidatus Sericytochromatia bacterium]|nr:hypothetical protein [Candidatus Tanganyikabacteria bacterium]